MGAQKWQYFEVLPIGAPLVVQTTFVMKKLPSIAHKVCPKIEKWSKNDSREPFDCEKELQKEPSTQLLNCSITQLLNFPDFGRLMVGIPWPIKTISRGRWSKKHFLTSTRCLFASRPGGLREALTIICFKWFGFVLLYCLNYFYIENEVKSINEGEHLESSKIVHKSIAIHPQALISHFKQIINHKKTKNTITHRTNPLIVFSVLPRFLCTTAKFMDALLFFSLSPGRVAPCAILELVGNTKTFQSNKIWQSRNNQWHYFQDNHK